MAPQALIRHMQSHSIHCIASKDQSSNFKFFFFGQKMESSTSNYLVECIINTSSTKAQIKIKADDQSTSQVFSTLFQSALSKFDICWALNAFLIWWLDVKDYISFSSRKPHFGMCSRYVCMIKCTCLLIFPHRLLFSLWKETIYICWWVGWLIRLVELRQRIFTSNFFLVWYN